MVNNLISLHLGLHAISVVCAFSNCSVKCHLKDFNSDIKPMSKSSISGPGHAK